MRNSSLFSLFALLFSITTVFSHGTGHKCIHDEMESDYDFLDVEEEALPRGERALLEANYTNLKIYPYYAPLADAPADFVDYIEKQLVPPVLAYYQGALKNKFPLTTNLKVSSTITTLCSIPTPSILTTTGVPADFFIMFQSEDNAETNYAAMASYCYLSTGSKRPLIARAMFNRKYITLPNGDPLIHEMNTYTLMHELMHAFGFSKSAYQYYLDEYGVLRTGHVISKNVYGTANSTILNIPALTTKLRNFFGCSTLEGAYLENNGGDATAGSHFERRQFVYEAMSSGAMHGKRLSQFSLSVLEGSGWYAINYTYAEPYYFGRGQGCTFLKGNCSSSSFTFDEFCKSTYRGCASHGRAGGMCSPDSNTQGCDYVYPSYYYDCENPLGANYSRYPDLEVYGRGKGSKCFEGNLTKSKNSTFVSFCFKYSCTGTGTSTILNVQLGNTTVQCTKEGPLTVTGYNGALTCPDPLSFCTTIGKAYCPRNCMGRGKCVSGKCTCNKGFTGVDCALTI